MISMRKSQPTWFQWLNGYLIKQLIKNMSSRQSPYTTFNDVKRELKGVSTVPTPRDILLNLNLAKSYTHVIPLNCVVALDTNDFLL